jgi:hypothetical protein
MEESEREIALVKVNQGGTFSTTDYDLHLTTGRMVFIRTKSTKQWGAWVGGATGGIVGSIIGSVAQKGLESKKKQNEQNLQGTLDEALKRDNKNFELAYDDVEKVRLNEALRNRRLEVYLKKVHVGFHCKQLEFVGLSKEHFENLSALLPTISALKGKIEI